uniref:Uncharacterized protein n=1 Tax=Arundo donax TaxID=35708 RepID=A0A0A9E0Z9_ARUDO
MSSPRHHRAPSLLLESVLCGPVVAGNVGEVGRRGRRRSSTPCWKMESSRFNQLMVLCFGISVSNLPFVLLGASVMLHPTILILAL